MAYHIQTKRHWETKWKTSMVHQYATLKDALSALEDLGVHVGDEYRIAESYTVTATRYKPVKVK